MKSVLTLLLSGAFAAASFAQSDAGCDDLIAAYKACTGINGTALAEYAAPNVKAEDGKPAPNHVIRGVTYTDTYGVTGFTRSQDADPDSSYLAFTFESTNGNVLNVTGLDLSYSRDVGGPRKLVIRSSADGYSSDLFVDNDIETSPEFNAPRFDTPIEGDEITFRIYLSDAGVGDYNGLFNLNPFDGNPDGTALQFKGCSISSLPVELTSFAATAAGDFAELTWTTASERDNDYFSVERSDDGLLFAEVGRVSGAGTTGRAQSYSFAQAADGDGTVYFRLRQVDFDGQYDYSDVVAVDFEGTQSLSVANTVAQNELQVVTGEETLYNVMTLSGNVALSGQLGEGRTSLDVSSLRPGMYILTDGKTSVRFVK